MIKISDLIYDAEIIIEDNGEYYEAILTDGVVDAYGVEVKTLLKKGKRLTRKELMEVK